MVYDRQGNNARVPLKDSGNSVIMANIGVVVVVYEFRNKSHVEKGITQTVRTKY